MIFNRPITAFTRREGKKLLWTGLLQHVGQQEIVLPTQIYNVLKLEVGNTYKKQTFNQSNFLPRR